jgi:D-alanine-D-alanine ligase
MKIGVFWRPERNINLEREYAPADVQDDAYEEAYQHTKALQDAGYETVLIQWEKEPMKTIQQLRKKKPDFVFNAASDEEVALLEIMGIPFVGSGLDLTPTDKAIRKQVVAYHNIPTPDFVVVRDPENVPDINIGYPLFVKALRGRGSAGISDDNIAENRQQLVQAIAKVIRTTGQAALVEKFIEGREISVGIVGYEDSTQVMPLLEIEYNGTRTNTYEHKMDDEEIIHCPADLGAATEKRIRDTARKIFKVLNARDYGRLDMILSKENVPYFLELNTFAGLTMAPEKGENYVHNSYMGFMAEAAGMTRGEFIGTIMEAALSRAGYQKKHDFQEKKRVG